MRLTTETILQIVRPHCPDCTAATIHFEPLKTGKFNDSYKIYAPTETFILRLAPSRDAVFVFYEREMMRQEPALHALLNEQTAVPVPLIYAFDDSHTVVPRDYILMNCLPGRPLTEMPQVDFDFVLRQVGQMLAEVHALHHERYGYVGAHRPMVPQDTWVDAFEVMWHKLLDDVVMVGYYNTAERQFLAERFSQHRPLFDRPLPASLLHMDVWHENILVDEQGVVTGLIDWDRAVWGDPEIEFAILDYCSLSGPAFWEGYGQPRDTSAEAQIRQHFYLLYELQKYIVIYHGRNREPDRAAEKKRQVLQLVRQAFT